MVSREPAESSSSPSASITIEGWEKKGSRGERLEVRLSDGSFFFVARDVFLTSGLGRGDIVSAGQIRLLEQRSAEKEAEDKALLLLGRAPHSTWTLRGKLLRRGYERDLIDRVLARMTEAGYLNDGEYAREWLRQRLQRHPEGRPLLLAGLLRRGLERRTAEAAVDAVFDAEAEGAAIRFLLDKSGGAAGLGRAEAERRLRARRFRTPAVREALAGYPEPEEG
jgi:SOS response regulatory protein OraA/RecX